MKTRMAGALVLGLSTMACFLFPRPSELDELDEGPRQVTLEVENDNFYDATIYAVRPGLRWRIGFVVGNTSETFEFTWSDLDLRFEIDLLSVGSYFTWSMPVEPGDQLALRVLPNLHTRPPGTVF